MLRSVLFRIAVAVQLIGASFPLVAQTGEVFAPFVSGLRARAEGAVVQLSWRASQDVSTNLHVYRSATEIDAESFVDAERISILAGSSTGYQDIPAQLGSYYYAVLLENPDGGLYEAFIAFRNKTSSAITIEQEATVEQLAATVTNLRSVSVDEGVAVAASTTELLAPTASATSLTAGLPSSPVAPPAGAPPVSRATGGPAPSRHAPLPFLQIGQGVAIDAASLANEPVLDVAPDMSLVAAARDVRLSATAIAAVEALIAQRPAAPRALLRAVDVLPDDELISSGREDQGLQTVVHEDLLAGNYAAAVPRFREYLKLRRSEATEARAHFYLAQALYFEGDYRSAILELLLASAVPEERTSPWINATLAALRQESTTS